MARPTVREAVNALQMMNLLRVRHGEPTQVADLSPGSLVEPFELMSTVGTLTWQAITEVRATLEAGISRLAAERASEEEIEAIGRFAGTCEPTLEDPEALFAADVASMPRSWRRQAIPCSPVLWRRSRGSRSRAGRRPAVREGAIQEHAAIVAAIRQGDGDGAAAAMLAHENRYPHQLSRAMRQRVSIARALIHDPAIVLMDESFGALDAITRTQIRHHLEMLWLQRRMSVLFITHSVEEAVGLSDRVLVMSPSPGRFVEEIVIDLPRPRHGLLREPAFLAYADRISALFEKLGVYNASDDHEK